ncbi:MAG: glycoside hydrolase family protein [Lachnospiraceae bacterium]|nr:glycoside hydrolase family protein [Lachnospiraceae bacterium]
MAFVTSQKGINLIKEFESCRLTAYQDIAGVWTIGYGHTGGVSSGMTISQAQAEAYLKSDLARFEKAVNKYVTVGITQNMFDALVSFTFNLGEGSLANSTLLKKLNAGDVSGAANEFDKWVYASGKVSNGLVRRRAAEKALFLNGAGVSGGTTTPSANSTIKSFQSWLNSTYAAGLSTDGCYGPNTKKAATIAYQKELKVTADGIFGANSKAAVVVLKSGSRGNSVHILQGMLYCLGYDPNGVDGIYGTGTVNAVKKFQSGRGLTSDGIAGANTMYALYN